MKDVVRELLKKMGEDPEREGLKDTPRRVMESYKFLMSGYDKDPVELIKNAMFEDRCDEMVVLNNIPTFSMCEHHLLPFYGKTHVAYIPGKKIVGISKIVRMVDLYARRLQLQERMTNQIANTLDDVLKPKGVAVVIEAEHLCMQMRGVQKLGATMKTSAMLGVFKTNSKTRAEFLTLIKN